MKIPSLGKNEKSLEPDTCIGLWRVQNLRRHKNEANYIFHADEEDPDGDSNVSPGQLASETKDHEFSALQNFEASRMVPCDNLQTAGAIALESGILGSNADAEEPNLIEGKSFYVMTEAQRLEVAKRISVMARSLPYDKLSVAQALRGCDFVVIEDGTNVAPVLHEVTRWQRSVYAFTHKFIEFLLTINVVALVINVVAAVSSGDIPIEKFIQFQLTAAVAALLINVVTTVFTGDVLVNAVQLLWVNLTVDTLGALAQPTGPPTDNPMDRLPVGRREPLVAIVMFLEKFTMTVRFSWKLWLVSIAIGLSVGLLLLLGNLYLNPRSRRVNIFTDFSSLIHNAYHIEKKEETGNTDDD
ncbi:hypothetical protein L2E82_12309 [Cichorium intybus]|uniref:Uncharacterized protein n=1 Tax=Cichorium intybus TaxID=13427 RepID=A0ACB9GFR1_CICIN|nr:hypothetical protein L2E82_12309 [Cichorium intybus]